MCGLAAAARARGAFDELQIFSAKNYGAQRAEIIGKAAHGLVVERKFPLSRGPIHFDFVRGDALDRGSDKVAFRAVPNQLRTAYAAEGAQRGKEVDGFQDVGLALGIVPQQEVEAWRKISIQPRVVAEIAKSQMRQMHTGTLAARRGEGELVGWDFIDNDRKPYGVASAGGMTALATTLLADAPILTKIFDQETCRNHANSIVHQTSFVQLAHAGINNWKSSFSFTPFLKFLLIVAPSNFVETHFE